MRLLLFWARPVGAGISLCRVTAWQRWHDDYDDPDSDLSARLVVVQGWIQTGADQAPAGPLRLISVCAGQGHDVIGALGPHRRSRDVRGLLVERDVGNVAAAERGLKEGWADRGDRRCR